jgi:glutaredoxin
MLFTTRGCTPCVSLKTHLEKIGVKFQYLKCEIETDKAQKYHIRSVPCLVHTDDYGTMLDSITGFQKQLITDFLERHGYIEIYD